jgi:hypothetical protein
MKKTWRWLHYAIIIGFIINALYSGYMVFFVIGGGPPLFHRATELAFETLIARRLYAIETWITLTGLVLYLGITEILPMKLSTAKHIVGD